jgi:UDP-3-O-[3-hydroxymyristoyl] glucosamine N-acyltransferase
LFEAAGMSEPRFFRRACTPTLREILDWTGAEASSDADLDREITGAEPLDAARPGDIACLENTAYFEQFKKTRATACFVSRRFAAKAPEGTVALVTSQPYRSFGKVLGRMFPDALRPGVMFATNGVAPGAFIHPEARLEPGVLIDPGVVVGARAEIGAGTRVAAHAVIGPDVRIGRDCSIGPHVSVMHALIGDRVILHPGVRIGQDGFGFAMSSKGHTKVPQIGRVIVQNDVEIGANTTIDRGATRDTVVGEGAQIDNLVQIAHNVTIGRHCVIVAQVGISGSSTVEDFAALGGQAGIAGHLRVGAGAQVAAKSGVMADVPPGGRWGGYPAVPIRTFFRLHVAALKRLRSGNGAGTGDEDAE